MPDWLLDTVADGVTGVTPAGVAIYWNRAAERLCGWDRSESATLRPVLDGDGELVGITSISFGATERRVTRRS